MTGTIDVKTRISLQLIFAVIALVATPTTAVIVAAMKISGQYSNSSMEIKSIAKVALEISKRSESQSKDINKMSSDIEKLAMKAEALSKNQFTREDMIKFAIRQAALNPGIKVPNIEDLYGNPFELGKDSKKQ